jgi:hypothetical protein
MRFALALTVLAAVVAADPDRDGDGLSDFSEQHKYFTNPDAADSDGDGKPDGDPDERREYAYTIRTVVQVMRPVTVAELNDDYQDVRVLEEGKEWVKLEVIHYPLNTVAGAIGRNPNWRQDYAGMQEYLAPGLTSNWDDALRKRLLAALAADGIDVAALADDKQVVERASAWLMRHARYHTGFTTFLVHFPGGKPAILPGLEDAAERNLPKGLTLKEEWDRELFAKGMFEHGARGSCTSSAIYLCGCLRALGIPTRIVLCIPVVDGSDAAELEMVRKGITHHRVRQVVRQGVERLGRSWASHTFNEVYVGGRWHRLNYQRLGQNILDPGYFGLLTHVLTVRDWSDANIAQTVGLRQGKRRYDDAFGGSNPYSTLELSDRFGAHAKTENEPVPEPVEFKRLTIVRAFWYWSAEGPDKVEMDLRDPREAGHVLFKVKENQPDGGAAQYRRFYDQVGKEFVLRAKGRKDVHALATRGYWAGPGVFYLRIEPAELKRMALGVPYALVAKNGHADYQWAVSEEATLTRRKIEAPPGEFGRLTLVKLVWSDSKAAPESMRGRPPVLLARPKEWSGFDKLKRFTQHADKTFFLEAKGAPALKVRAHTGGTTSPDGSTRWITLAPVGPRPVRGVRYRLRARNNHPLYTWVVKKGLSVKR